MKRLLKWVLDSMTVIVAIVLVIYLLSLFVSYAEFLVRIPWPAALLIIGTFAVLILNYNFSKKD